MVVLPRARGSRIPAIFANPRGLHLYRRFRALRHQGTGARSRRGLSGRADLGLCGALADLHALVARARPVAAQRASGDPHGRGRPRHGARSSGRFIPHGAHVRAARRDRSELGGPASAAELWRPCHGRDLRFQEPIRPQPGTFADGEHLGLHGCAQDMDGARHRGHGNDARLRALGRGTLARIRPPSPSARSPAPIAPSGSINSRRVGGR